MSEPPKKEWWEELFDDKYLATYIDTVTSEDTEREVSFIIEKLRLKKDSDILDVACGYGRHAIAFAEKGYKVTGVDYSANFIAKAREEAKRKNLQADFIQGDMRNLMLKNQFDVALNLFTSFGYFTKEEDHEAVLKSIYSALKTNGLFLIDVTNVNRLVSNLSKNGTASGGDTYNLMRKAKLSNGLEVTTEHHVDMNSMRWQMTRSWQDNGDKKSYTSDVRLFTFPEMSSLMKNSKFSIKDTWGGFDGSPYDEKESSRMIILAQK